jgi:hypothetical protein
MSTVEGGGNIVTDGLVLCLDAANTKSYVSGSTTWNDLSRSGNDGTLTNEPTFDSQNAGSIVFDGTNDYVNLRPSIITGAEVSISLWYYKTVSTQSWTFNANNSSGGRELGSHIPWNDGVIYWDCGNNGGTDLPGNWDRISKISNGNHIGWHNWVFWKNASIGEMKIYKDGIEWHKEIGKTKLIGPTTIFNIATKANISEFDNAKLALIKIYNRALTAQEVLQNYNATKARFGL